MKKSICIIGIGGRTGVMFGRELQNGADVFGVGLAREIELINGGKIFVVRGGGEQEVFKANILISDNSNKIIQRNPDYIWVAVRNPVVSAVEYYYRGLAGKNNLPALIVSQNGLSAISDAKAGLNRALGASAAKVAIIRVSVINGVDMAVKDNEMVINYKLPVKLGFGLAQQTAEGRDKIDNLEKIFSQAGFRAQRFDGEDVLKMENSKLFTNLIGMAAASRGVKVSAGLRDRKIFKEEVAMLKEFVSAVKNSGSGFLPMFAGYPIFILANLMLIPDQLLAPLRGIFERIVTKGRNRPKDLSEVDYYNGEVVKLGRKTGMATPINAAVVDRAKEFFKN